VEALLRWRSAELGGVPPTEFIPHLEADGGIVLVGEWVLRQACEQSRRWLDRGEPICFSVNVSAQQFASSDVEGLVRRVLAEFELPPGLLGLELTEGMLLESSDAVRAALSSLRDLGVKIAVDDFGTGYASLAYLKKFPMSAIKIDREFVRGLPLDAENSAITSSIVGLAHSLAFEVVAEGVETEAEEEFLRSLQCDIVQGFLHARPMLAADLEGWHEATFGRTEAQGRRAGS
jgi:EAL domain-containing protein (putative c-di-GMP-specific phosphodiesterase class I)